MNLISTLRKTIGEHSWIAFVLPMAVFMIFGSLEPRPNGTAWPFIPYHMYPWVYAAKLLATIATLILVWPEYRPHCQRIGWQGIFVGLLGACGWISLCNLHLEQNYIHPMLKSLGLDSLIGDGERSAFNPFQEYSSNPSLAIAYLLVRGFGLILVVPIMEEYFLRGFVMRYVATDDWKRFPIGQLTMLSAIVGTLLPVLMHPGELIAAAVWFTMISVLAWRTKNLWECIAAHSTTNLILGIYVLTYGAWHLV